MVDESATDTIKEVEVETPPAEIPSAETEIVLPPDWKAASAPDGKIYYYNEKTHGKLQFISLRFSLVLSHFEIILHLSRLLLYFSSKM